MTHAVPLPDRNPGDVTEDQHHLFPQKQLQQEHLQSCEEQQAYQRGTGIFWSSLEVILLDENTYAQILSKIVKTSGVFAP